MSHQNTGAGLRSLSRPAGGDAIPMRPYPWRSRIALPAAIILAVLLAAVWAARDAVLPAVEVQVIPVVLRPTYGPVPASPGAAPAGASAAAASGGVIAQAAGWVEPDPYAVAVTGLTDGVISEVLVLEGQRVEQGDVVARLIPDDAKLAVQRAQADLAAKRAELQAAQATWDNPVERQRAVAASKAALDETRAELHKVDADVAAERAHVEEMADLVARLEKLVPLRASAELELVSARFKLDAQRAVVTATEARGPVLDALIRQKAAEATAAEENARLRIEETRSLKSAEAAMLAAQAALAEAQLRLARTDVRSPAAGVVMTRLAEPGGKLMLSMDAPHSAYVARLYDPARLQVRVDVPLAEAHKIGVGTRAEVTAEALPGRSLRGEVTRIVNEADLTKNTLQYKVRIIDATDALKPEMLARVKFFASRPAAGPSTAQASAAGESAGSYLPFVPQRLIQRDGHATTVLTADRGRGLAVRKTVEVASDAKDGWIAIASGVAAGDDLIALPDGVADGTRVRIVGEATTADAPIGATERASHGKDGH